MVTLNINTQQLGQLQQQFEKAFRSVPKVAKEGLKWAGEQTALLLRREALPVKYTGTLDSSIGIVEEGKDYVVVGADTAVAPHATHVVEGGPPRSEPFGKILAWTDYRNIMGGGRAAAWKVWHGIRQRGTSQHAIAMGWSNDGGNPFHERVIQSGDMQRVIDKAADSIGQKIAAEIVTP